MKTRTLNIVIVAAGLSGCGDFSTIGKVPDLSNLSENNELNAMRGSAQTSSRGQDGRTAASLWTASRDSLLGDRRAIEHGDILTVVIEVDESAEISNNSSRGRTGSESLSIPSLLGIPQRIDADLPDGASLASAIDASSSANSTGTGTISRNEKLELVIAATIIDVLENGVLHIQGSQEIRVNFEIRELLVEGFVRPEDISRQNTITYDKIASARISYGGRGHITDVQQPRYGQQISDKILPF